MIDVLRFHHAASAGDLDRFKPFAFIKITRVPLMPSTTLETKSITIFDLSTNPGDSARTISIHRSTTAAEVKRQLALSPNSLFLLLTSTKFLRPNVLLWRYVKNGDRIITIGTLDT